MKKPLTIRSTRERISICKSARIAIHAAKSGSFSMVVGPTKYFVIATAEKHHVIVENGRIVPAGMLSMERPREI